MKYKLFANCKPVRGKTRSIIYDLQRRNYKFIPNSLYEILVKEPFLDTDALKLKYSDDRETVSEYMEFLLENEFIHSLNSPEHADQFPALSTSYIKSEWVQTVVIWYSPIIFKESEDFGDFVLRIGARHAIIWLTSTEDMENLFITIKELNRTKLRSLEINIGTVEEKYEAKRIAQLLNHNTKILRIRVFNSESEGFDEKYNYIERIKGSWDSFYHTKDEVNPRLFSINMDFFNEATQYNPFLFKRLEVNSAGEFRNHSEGRILGHINDLNSLFQYLKRENYYELASVSKGQISKCEDCEYRYMCFDTRIPRKDKDGKYYYANDCGYDPSTAQWKVEN